MDQQTQNLTPQLNDQQIRENIDALKSGGLPDDQIQKYVDNYQKGTDGSYVLKGSQAQSQQTFSTADSTIQKTPGFLGKVADFIGGSKVAQAAGSLINDTLGGNQGAFDAAKESGVIEQKLADQILKNKEGGKDTTRLEKAFAALRNDSQAASGQLANLSTGGVTNKEVVGSAVQLGADAIPGLAEGAGLGAKVLEGAATGYAMDVGNKMQNPDKTTGQDFIPGAGTVVGTALPLAGAGISAITDKLPGWFVQKALPKLDPGNVDFATKTLDAGSIKSNLIKSTAAVKSSGNVIDAILSHPQYAEETGDIGSIINNTIDKYPNAQLTQNKVASVVKSVAPLQKDLIDKVINETANIAEQNQLRQTLDKAIYPKFTDTPSLTANKQIAKVFTDSLRSNVQNTAPETKDLFSNFAKEINLNQALTAAKTKLAKGAPVSLYDIAAGIGGGIPGIIGERVGRSPAAQISAAKGIGAISKIAGTKTAKIATTAANTAIKQAASKTIQ